jgi:hypothetical protein
MRRVARRSYRPRRQRIGRGGWLFAHDVTIEVPTRQRQRPRTIFNGGASGSAAWLVVGGSRVLCHGVELVGAGGSGFGFGFGSELPRVHGGAAMTDLMHWQDKVNNSVVQF